MATTWTDFLRNAYGGLTDLLGYAPSTTSGLRTQADNTRVGGAVNSWHLQGRSLDFIPMRGQSMADLYNDMRATGIPWTELLNEGDHVHGTFPQGWSGVSGAQSGAASTEDCKAQRGLLLGWTCDTQAGWDILTGRRTDNQGRTLYEAGADSAWSGLAETFAKPAVRAGLFILGVALIIGAFALMAAGSKQVQAAAVTALKAAT